MQLRHVKSTVHILISSLVGGSGSGSIFDPSSKVIVQRGIGVESMEQLHDQFLQQDGLDASQIQQLRVTAATQHQDGRATQVTAT